MNADTNTNVNPAAAKILPKFDVFPGVQLPAVKRGSNLPRGPRGSIYPVAQLEVGSAFFVGLEEGEDLDTKVKTVQSSVSRLAKDLKYKLAIRKLVQSDNPAVNPWGEPGVGVWRVAGEYIYKPRPKPEATPAAA